MQHPLLFIVFILLFNHKGACQLSNPSLEVEESYVVGNPILLKAVNLTPKKNYQIKALKSDVWQRNWIAAAEFTADQQGTIDIGSQQPISGSYQGIDAFGLLWSMQRADTMGALLKTPLDYNQITFILTSHKDTLAEETTKQWVIPQTIVVEEHRADIMANFMFPKSGSQRLPAILLLGGSGGGLSWATRTGALLANEGYSTMALAYFNMESLPKHLAQIPLEYIDTALEELKKRPEVDSTRIAIMGYSKGAELALISASRRNDIRAVVAFAPASAVFQGFKPPKYPVLSSWSEKGKDLPFVPNAYDEKFFRTYDGMYLWYKTLEQSQKLADGRIEVEKIRGDVLLISGLEDRIWPSTLMGEQIVGALYKSEFPYFYKHLGFPEAGHGIAVPPGEPTTSAAKSLGGTAAGNAYAREIGWKRMLAFWVEVFGRK